jgi:hypothetical protein
VTLAQDCTFTDSTGTSQALKAGTKVDLNSDGKVTNQFSLK